MKNNEAGGPAFPIPGEVYRMDGGTFRDQAHAGMTLRDYFAAKAMAAIIIGNGAHGTALTLGAAQDAYAVADCMLQARAELDVPSHGAKE